jgi:hypothetical protein
VRLPLFPSHETSYQHPSTNYTWPLYVGMSRVTDDVVGMLIYIQAKADAELKVLKKAKFRHEGTQDFHQW